MPASSIGTLTFLSMTGQPVTAGQQLQAETKAGVAYVGWWKMGIKGTEYSVETIRDVDTFANAVALAATYKLAQNSGALAVVYGGVSLGNVLVLRVDAKAESVAHGQGGLAGTSRAIVRGSWQLIAV